VHRFFRSRWTFVALAAAGWALLAGYLTLTRDVRVSVWALAVPIIALSVGWLFVWLKLFDNFPELNRYFFYSDTDPTRAKSVSNDDWALKEMQYLRGLFRGKAFLRSPAEDGLICVPVLLIGIGPLSVIIAGLAFAFLHLGRFTYLECIGKGITYTLVCYWILPYGILTVVVGHFVMNAIAFFVVEIGRRKLSEKLRSNTTVDADPRESSGAGHRER
jgi:TM2 domain-containing membrane protein YozV